MEALFTRTEKLLRDALTRQEGSAFAVLVEGKSKKWETHLGQTALLNSGGLVTPIQSDSIFDLASLTKALVTVPLLGVALSEKLLSVDMPVQKFFSGFSSSDVELHHLLAHSSGLKNHEEFYRRPEALEKGYISREEMLHWILASPLTPLSQAKVVYSDLGFLLLGFILEEVLGETIAELFEKYIRAPLGLKESGFRTLPHSSASERKLRLQAKADRFVATAHCGFHGRLLQGEVDDNNCWALGGATSHAGLFSTLHETQSLLANAVETALKFPEIFLPQHHSKPPFTQGFMLYPGLRAVKGDEWAGAIGHTGFVGTSAWFHPATNSSLICLGNRVHPDRADTRFIETRLEIQREAWEELS